MRRKNLNADQWLYTTAAFCLVVRSLVAPGLMVVGGAEGEGRRNKSAVRESGRISELKCLELFEGIVPGFAVMQQNLKQHLVKVSRGWRAILQAGC